MVAEDAMDERTLLSECSMHPEYSSSTLADDVFTMVASYSFERVMSLY